MLSGEFGVKDRIGALPATLSPYGIEHTQLPSLSTRERVLLLFLNSQPSTGMSPSTGSWVVVSDVLSVTRPPSTAV